MAFLTTPDERVYCKVTHPWDGLAATLAAGDLMRHIQFDANTPNPLLEDLGKNGSRSPSRKQGGRRSGAFTLSYPLAGSGAAGTPPDCAAALEAIFGQAGTVVPATSVTYDLVDTTPGLTVGSYRDPDGAELWQRVLFGGVIQSFQFSSSEEEATMEVQGIANYIADKPNFDSLDAGAKGGLASFPAEPVGGSFNGLAARGFTGAITIDGVGTYKLIDFTINGALTRDIRFAFGDYYPAVPSQGKRAVTIDLGIYEEDRADLNALRHRAYSKDPFDASVALGEDAGNIWTWNLKGLQLPGETLDESGTEYGVRWSGIPIAASALGARDEMQLVLT